MSEAMRRSYREKILPFVQGPGQYIGREHNSITKDHATVAATVALAFPDAYTIGMSHLGMQIFYHLLNRRTDVAAERVFCPWQDMEALLKKENLPLGTLETFTPVREFDLVCLSLQYELCATNVLTLLDRA
ncbi:MAG: B12-binding domain-containing radical SAM protein, partial [Planctomycetes bacterium]|nr:B12-binding domain-containing radical SAM protein [Planctomycetota bacterium]